MGRESRFSVILKDNYDYFKEFRELFEQEIGWI